MMSQLVERQRDYETPIFVVATKFDKFMIALSHLKKLIMQKSDWLSHSTTR